MTLAGAASRLSQREREFAVLARRALPFQHGRFGAVLLSAEPLLTSGEVVTDEGLSGWGEAGAAQGLEVLAAVVEKQLRPLLIGEQVEI